MLRTVGDLGTEVAGARPIDCGPHHPNRAGLVLIETSSDDHVITRARVQPGFNHRGAEKLFEVRDYRQALMLADRHDWSSPVHGELGLALACEQLLGLVAPERATWLRTLLAEFSRIQSHLAHLSWLPWRCNDDTTFCALQELREQGRVLMLELSGNRVHPMINRLGGLWCDASDSWLDRLDGWNRHARDLQPRLMACTRLVPGEGIGLLDAADISSLGLSGPVARASGIDLDGRRNINALAYSRLEWPTLEPDFAVDGSAIARIRMLALEVIESTRLIDQLSIMVRDIAGPVDTPLSKIIKLPESEVMTTLDAPWGKTGFHLVSRGERTPWRVGLRTPGFVNAQALETALVGCPDDHADAVVVSLGWTAGELDK